MEKVIATYHKDCIDGTAAAAVVLRKFPHARLFPLAHAYASHDLAPILALIDADTACYTVDCGLGAQAFLDLGCAVTTIDHHEGGKSEFEKRAADNPLYTFIFDNEKSGSSLSWSYFFPDEPLPETIAYIEDSDLWKHELGEATRDVNNYLSIFRNDPATMLACIEGDVEKLKEKGSVLSLYAATEIQQEVAIEPLPIRIGEHSLFAYNITSYVSSSGNILSEKLGQAVAMYTIKGKFAKISFRSKDGQSPSSLDLAKALGGGGHRNAAGATIPLEQFLRMVS